MGLRISLVLTLTVLLPSCGADKGGTSQTAATSDDTTGGSTTSQSTSTDEPTIAGTTDGSVTNGSSTDVTSSSPTTSDTGDTGGGIKEDCEAASVSEYQLEVLNCSCLVELGEFPDLQSCLMWVEPASEQQMRTCTCDVLATDPSTAAEAECNRDLWGTVVACLTPLECSDISARGACFDAFFDHECGDTPKQTSGQIYLQCEGGTSHMCGSGEAIPHYWTCDDTNDCMDGSDEAVAICKFMCGSGELINNFSVCNGVSDCMDMSDETKEMCKFDCGDGQDIPKGYVCDGWADCANMSDEAMCP